jgi:hypothetical protein
MEDRVTDDPKGGTMSDTALLIEAPVRGVEYDHSRPETRPEWMEQRRGGITATEVRDWGSGSEKRAIITFKVTGDYADLSDIRNVQHGNLREPQIAAWVQAQFDIAPCNNVYSHARNSRWLASPDGVSLDPFTGSLLVGTEDAVLAEIKTSVHDLTPGPMDGARRLISVAEGSPFDKSNYYTQVQWQMLVMNATMTLFVYEKRTDQIDPETDTYVPDGPPEWCWIPRDQAFIDVLVEKVATPALAEIDAARLAHTLGELPPVSDLPTEVAVLVADYFQALDNEKIAAAAKAKAWTALHERFMGPDKPDVSIDAGFARVTVSTSSGFKSVVDEDGMRAKARTTVERYEALRKRFTSTVPESRQTLRITRPKSS